MRRLGLLLAFLASPVSAQELTGEDMAAFRQAVSQCWLAADTTTAVTIGFSLSPEGRVEGEIRLISHSDGASAEAAEKAFAAARRAVLRCGQDGYDLPIAAYDSWKEVQLHFNPGDMGS